ATESVSLPGVSNIETYLNSSALIRIALEKGVDAIHPGYGFLSENAQFAREVIANNLIFIGPSPVSIEAMGHKIRAKKLAREAGVPLVPGNTSPVISVTKAVEEANAIGYPVLLKASAGGGGKGMRTIHSDVRSEERRVGKEGRSLGAHR